MNNGNNLPCRAGSWSWPSQNAAAKALRVTKGHISNRLNDGTFVDWAIMRMAKMEQRKSHVDIVDGDQYLIGWLGAYLPRMCRRELEDFHAVIGEALKVPHVKVKRHPAHGGPM